MQKILGTSTEAQDFLTVLRSRRQRTGANRLSLLVESRLKRYFITEQVFGKI